VHRAPPPPSSPRTHSYNHHRPPCHSFVPAQMPVTAHTIPVSPPTVVVSCVVQVRGKTWTITFLSNTFGGDKPNDYETGYSTAWGANVGDVSPLGMYPLLFSHTYISLAEAQGVPLSIGLGSGRDGVIGDAEDYWKGWGFASRSQCTGKWRAQEGMKLLGELSLMYVLYVPYLLYVMPRVPDWHVQLHQRLVHPNVQRG
jgi:hypothetical protein